MAVVVTAAWAAVDFVKVGVIEDEVYCEEVLDDFIAIAPLIPCFVGLELLLFKDCCCGSVVAV